jgi:hypothetical protein
LNDLSFQEFPKHISINNLSIYVERNLLNSLVTKDNIITGKRALINCEKFSTYTDNKNFTIRYLNSTSYKYDKLKNFYDIEIYAY